MQILRAVLGWSNPKTAGGSNVRLYALDEGDSPRWAADGGRTVERALVERDGGTFEGDRYLIVRLGDRFFSTEMENEFIEAIVRKDACHRFHPHHACEPGINHPSAAEGE